MKGKWLINGQDLFGQWSVALKKGSYEALFAPPQSKEYLTQDYRDKDGEIIYVDNPRVMARDVKISFVFLPEPGRAFTDDEFMARYYSFIEYLRLNPIVLYVPRFEMGAHLLYKSATVKGKTGRWAEIAVTFRENDPSNILSSGHLLWESPTDGGMLLTEGGDALTTYYKFKRQ